MSGSRSEHMTQSQKEQLEAELAEMEGPQRQAAIAAIATARGFGDLSENFEYHSAKDAQGHLEARIRALRERLHHAVIIDESKVASSDAIVVGSKVTIEDERGERLAVEISSVGGVSPESPLGSALLGARAGDEVEVSAPRGAWRARVVSIG
jgi:transcription elongation factor GreA